MDGISGFHFTLLHPPGAKIPDCYLLHFTLATFSSVLISSTQICEEIVYFNSMLSPSFQTSSRSASNICVTAGSFYASLTTPFCANSWKIRKVPELQLMLCDLCASSFYRLLTSKVIGTCDRAFTAIISISNKDEYPHIFLTMTCNLQGPKIKNALLSGQNIINCPDILATVFRVKLRAIVLFVIYEQVLGEERSPVRVIEFQKRGLLYAHYIFFMAPQSTRISMIRHL